MNELMKINVKLQLHTLRSDHLMSWVDCFNESKYHNIQTFSPFLSVFHSSHYVLASSSLLIYLY